MLTELVAVLRYFGELVTDEEKSDQLLSADKKTADP